MENWTEENNALCKTFVFASFEAAMLFMQNATPYISQLNHHPEWQNVYNRVSVRLTTHDAGKTITEKDRELTRVLDGVFAEMGA
jgi:4a-hydroxytetrahydrobiopterin dehydratase